MHSVGLYVSSFQLCPWTLLGDFRPQTPCFVPLTKFLATPLMLIVLIWRTSDVSTSVFSTSILSLLKPGLKKLSIKKSLIFVKETHFIAKLCVCYRYFL